MMIITASHREPSESRWFLLIRPDLRVYSEDRQIQSFPSAPGLMDL